ncbi:hypothetical protein ACFYZ4_04940 [Streptomyces sp. NPDC001513]|uniref:hypothetical protein n=1 Tax=Streptomyces sp. NPDC001513 TaxID=3364580 RepID=UPI0036AE6380
MSLTAGHEEGALPGPTASARGRQAPSAVERGLYEAKARGNRPAYYDLVARADLYMMQSRAYADANAGNTRFRPYWNPQTRTVCLAVHTGGMLPPPVADPVYNCHDLGWFTEVRDQNDPPYLVVNPGSPCEGVLPAGPEGRAPCGSVTPPRSNVRGRPRTSSTPWRCVAPAPAPSPSVSRPARTSTCTTGAAGTRWPTTDESGVLSGDSPVSRIEDQEGNCHAADAVDELTGKYDPEASR